MEDDDNISNSIDQFGAENRIVQQRLHTNISIRSEKLFWYDIQNLPDSLLIEILVRLPVKSIFLFKIVCKHWQTLISHRSFYRFYHSILNSNSKAALPFRFLHRDTCVPNFKEFVIHLAPQIHSWSEFSLLLPPTHEAQYRYSRLSVLDISNGLILCCFKSTLCFFYICDPLTRLWITIPTRGPRMLHIGISVGLITSFNEDHMLTGYIVVRAEILPSPSNDLTIEMFSSETGKWIVYNLPCGIPIHIPEFSFDDGSIQCYGALHWPVYHDLGIHGIVAFDPYKDPKSLRLIPLPEDRVLLESEYDYFWVRQLCGESQGTLRYFEVANDPDQLYFLRMWAMKDYEKGEWFCYFKVRRSDIHSSNWKLSNLLLRVNFWPLSFHPLNQNVVYLWCMDQKCIVTYDVLNRRLEVACIQTEYLGHLSSIPSVIPFVLPRWPTGFNLGWPSPGYETMTLWSPKD